VAPPREPLPWQQRALALPESYNLALLGGRGGGKSTAIVQLVYRHCIQYGERAKPLIIRQSYKALADIEEALLELLHAGFAEFPGGVQYNKADKIGRLPNGATFELGFIEDQRSYLKHQGRETTLLCIDEVTNFATLKYVSLLRSNLRGPVDIPLRVVIAGNPGGPLHATIARQHVSGRVPWRPYEGDDGTLWVTCPSVYTDNEHLDHARYARQLRAAAGNDAALAAAWLENNWGEIAGAFFGSVFGPHCVIPDAAHAPRGKGWETFVSLDWGMSAPSVVLFCARPLLPGLVGPSGRVFSVGSVIVLDELATADAADPAIGLEWPPSMLAEETLARCKRWGVRPRGVGDDARGLDGSTLLEQFKTHGLHLRKPTKDRVSGWVMVKQMMDAARRDDPDQPALFFTERCRYCLETIPALPRNQIRVEDVDTKAPDHAADAVRYAVATKPKHRRVSVNNIY